MKNIKKFLLMFLILLLSTVSVFAADYQEKEEVLISLGIITEQHNADFIVSKQELASAASRLITNVVTSPEVSNTDEACDSGFVYETVIKTLGYENYARMLGGYEKAAVNLDIASEASYADGKLTYEGMVGVLFSALETPLIDVSGSRILQSIKQKEGIYLTEKLDLSVYEGTITSVDNKKWTVAMNIDANVYETNDVLLNIGSSHIFDAEVDIDINKFDKVPVVAWVDSDENIVCMYPKKYTEVIYSPIYAVNNDEDRNHAYKIENVDTIMLLDDDEEYEVSAGAELRVNGKITDNAYKLAGSYAKLVFYKEEIIFIETWDLTEGGILTEVESTKLRYIKGSSQMCLLSLGEYDKTIVIINDESRDFADLKPDTYFDFFKIADDTLVIVASENIVTSKFESVSGDYLTIGNIRYMAADRVYYSEDGQKYVLNEAKLHSAMGSDVSIYFNSMRECAYVKLAQSADIKTINFIGAVVGYDGYEDYINGYAGTFELGILDIENSLEEKLYPIAKKVQLEDGLTISEIVSNRNDINGEGIYQFFVNSEGVITKISAPDCLYGFETSPGKTVGTVDFSAPEYKYTIIGSKRIYHSMSLPVTVIYNDENGDFTVCKAKYSDFTKNSYEQVGNGAQVHFYGYENDPSIRLAVITGARNFHKWDYNYAVIKKNGKALNEQGEVRDSLILVYKDTKREVLADSALSAILPDVAYVQYSGSVSFGDSEIVLPNGAGSILLDLSGDYYDWVDNVAIKTGIISEVYSETVILDNSDGYYIHPSEFIVFEVADSGEMTEITKEELEPGESVYYYILDGAVSVIFVNRA